MMLRYIHPKLPANPALGGEVFWGAKKNQRYPYIHLQLLSSTGNPPRLTATQMSLSPKALLYQNTPQAILAMAGLESISDLWRKYRRRQDSHVHHPLQITCTEPASPKDMVPQAGFDRAIGRSR